MTRSPGVVLAGVLAAALLVAACANSSPSPSITASSQPTLPPLGGTLRAGMDLAGYESFQVNEEGTFNHAWDPQTTWAAEPFELFRCCLLRTLMSYNGRSTREGGAELQPDLAADFPTISADGLTWTFKLKPGIHYAPPYATTTVVSADFIRAIERTLHADPFQAPEYVAFGPYSNYFSEVIAGTAAFTDGSASSISGLEAPDDQTLVIHLLRPAGDLGARLAMPAAAPIPAGAADGHDAGYGRYLVASGPYMIEGSDQLDPSLPPDQQPTVSGYVPGSHLTLVRNPSWERATDSLRSAFVDRIEISQIADYDAELEALQNDQMDVSFSTNLDIGDINRLRADSQLAPRIHVTAGLASDWIVMNLAVPPFDDVHVRRAVMLATNKKTLVGLLSPNAEVQNHAIPDALENGLLAHYDPYATTDNAGSLDRAKAEMALSRYDSNADGVCDDPACAQISVPVRNDRPEFSTASQAFASQLGALGVMLDVKYLDSGDFFGYAGDPENHNAIGFTLGWASDYPNASSWFEPLATGNAIATDSGANLSLLGAPPDQLRSWGYGVTQVASLDSQIDECVALTGAAQFSCWAETDQYVMERIASWIPLDNRQVSRLTSGSISSFEFDASLAMPALDQITVRLDR